MTHSATTTTTTTRVEALLDELWLDLDSLCQASGVDARWVQQRTGDGLLAPQALGAHDDWRFDAQTLRRVRCMVHIERSFDAAPELAALVADLEEEIARLRMRLGA